MFFGFKVNTNVNGVPYLRTTGVTVGTESVDFALGFRSIEPIGDITINVANEIPTGTTATLPVRFTLNGTTRTLTFFGGTAVTAGDLVGTGDIKVFHNFYNGTLQLTSPLAPTA